MHLDHAIVAMFEKDGWVDSPFLGKIAASDFFAKLGKASGRNIPADDAIWESPTELEDAVHLNTLKNTFIEPTEQER